MDGNSAQRGRHRHRAPSAPIPEWSPHSPQWTPAEHRPQWTDSVRPPEERAPGAGGPFRAPAAPDEAQTDWFAKVPSPREQPPASRTEPPTGWLDPVPPAAPAAPWADPAAWADPGTAQPDRPARGDQAGQGDQPAWGGPGGTPELSLAGASPAGPPARRSPVKHPVRLALYSVVILGLIAGTLAWVTMDKSVRLSVDGEPRALRTYAGTVAGALDDAGLTVGEHDVLAPAKDTKIADGAEITLNRGRLLRMTVDGKQRNVWVTATTVDEALSQVGYRENGMWVSADRSARLPLEGYDLALRMPKSVTLVVDGKTRTLSTTAETVGATLKTAGVAVDGDDKVSQLSTAAVVNGMRITVTRVRTVTQTVRTEVRFKTIEKADPDAEVGSKKVETEGKAGLQEVTYVVTYVNGKQTSRKVASTKVITKPVDEVVVVGPDPPPTQPAECADFPTTGGLNWCGLARCESGLNPNAYNPAGPYYGLYQFNVGTWQSNGGSGTPSGKSIAEQTRVAYNLYQARGASPWPTCGRYL